MMLGVDLAGADCCDRNTHHHGDDGQRELPAAAGLLSRLCPTGLLGLLPKLCGTGFREVLDSLSQARRRRIRCIRAQFHPCRQRSLGVAPQLLARLVRRAGSAVAPDRALRDSRGMAELCGFWGG